MIITMVRIVLRIVMIKIKANNDSTLCSLKIKKPESPWRFNEQRVDTEKRWLQTPDRDSISRRKRS